MIFLAFGDDLLLKLVDLNSTRVTEHIIRARTYFICRTFASAIGLSCTSSDLVTVDGCVYACGGSVVTASIQPVGWVCGAATRAPVYVVATISL
jgi:hypothetical protein